MCSDAELSNKKKFPTFGRTFAVDSQVGPSVVSLLKYTYNWTRVAILYQDTTQWTSLKDHLVKEFKKTGIDVAKEYMIMNEALYNYNKLDAEAEFRAALRDLKDKARSKYIHAIVFRISIAVTGFSRRAGDRRNVPATSGDFTSYFSCTLTAFD